jgi:ATP-dependent DNA ligase
MPFKPQKALHLYLELEKKRTKVDNDTFMVFEKYDGWYGFKRVDIGSQNPNLITTRNQRFLPSMTSFSASMGACEADNNIPLKGHVIFEILVEGVPLFSDLNGILNRSKAPCQATKAYIMVHDFVPDGNEDMPAVERYALAMQYVKMLNHPRVKIATVYGTGGHEVVQQVAEKVWARTNPNVSKEGAIGKRIDAPYSQGKKNKDIIKVKCEVSLEMEVVGWEKGQGKYIHTLGKLIVRQANGVQHSVSGMSDTERDLWYNDFSLINGAVVQIDAMQILPNGSLREGRYKCQRFDKSEID